MIYVPHPLRSGGPMGPLTHDETVSLMWILVPALVLCVVVGLGLYRPGRR